MAVTTPPSTLKITLFRSLIGYPEPQRVIARSLGLRKPNDTVVRPNTPEIRGMVRKIPHLLRVEVLEKS
jgi:large subunit ribosomal protein L30